MKRIKVTGYALQFIRDWAKRSCLPMSKAFAEITIHYEELLKENKRLRDENMRLKLLDSLV